MFNEKSNSTQRVARIIRAARKQLGYNQSFIAKELRISQSKISKIESGVGSVTPEEWYAFCELAEITPDRSWYSGHIDRCDSKGLQSGECEGSFIIPAKYSHLRGSKVRSILPILNYFEKTLGADQLNKYLKKVEIDEDFFVTLDNQLNVDFSLDLLRTMIDQGNLKRENISEMAASYRKPSLHGALASTYQADSNKIDRFINLTKSVKNYDVNCDYRVERTSDQFIEISVTPLEHLKAFQYKDDTLHDALCEYKKEVLKAFAHFGEDSNQKTSPVELKELECHFHGHSHKCVYRLGFIS